MPVYIPGFQVQTRDATTGEGRWRDVAFFFVAAQQSAPAIAAPNAPPAMQFAALPFFFDEESGNFGAVPGGKLRRKS